MARRKSVKSFGSLNGVVLPVRAPEMAFKIGDTFYNDGQWVVIEEPNEFGMVRVQKDGRDDCKSYVPEGLLKMWKEKSEQFKRDTEAFLREMDARAAAGEDFRTIDERIAAGEEI